MNVSPSLEAPDLPRAIRQAFPMLAGCLYLDTASAGLSFAGQGAAASSFYDDAKSLGYEGRDAWREKAASVRRKLAARLGVEASDINFFGNTTEALNLVAHSIDWRPGDEVVFAADEFPSVAMAWHAAEAAGASIRPVPVASEAEREMRLVSALTPRTRVLAVSHVHPTTGTRLDLQRLGAACRARDVLLVVDGIQALGAVPVDLCDVDVYCSAVFKYMLSGFGLAVCSLRGRARSLLKPAFRGYANPSPSTSLQYAHVNYPGLYALDAALTFLGETVGWGVVYRRTEALMSRLAEGLSSHGVALAAPAGARAAIASFAVADAEALCRRLSEQGIFVALRGGLMRASPFFYNTQDEIERFVERIARAAGGKG
ncbi:MAG: aminotransferase class V-fold PLP-dependent enzyme [Hyphomicrobiales bacterium]